MNDYQRRRWLAGDDGDDTPRRDPREFRGLGERDTLLRLHTIADRTAELNGKHRLSHDDRAELADLQAEGDALSEHHRQLVRGTQIAAEVVRGDWHPYEDGSGGYREFRSASGRYAIVAGSPTEDERPRDETRERRPRDPLDDARSAAMRVLDSNVRAATMAPEGAEIVERLMVGGSLGQRGWTAEWAQVTGDPDYLSAFAKKLADPVGARDRYSDREIQAVQQVHEFGQRAMSTVDTDGGVMIPAALDPAILLSSSGFATSIRQFARVVQITGESWRGVSSAGASSRWAAEGTESNDDSPELAQPIVPVFKGDCFVPYSIEIESSGAGFVTEVSRIMVDELNRRQNEAFVLGSGVGQPTGFVAALAGTASEINGDGTEAISAADPYKLQAALPARFQRNSAWAAALPVLNTLRQAETGNGAHAFPSLHGDPPTLLGRGVFEVSEMDSAIDAGATESNYMLALGDWSQFLIADRLGTRVEVVQHLVGANRRPTGQRGFYAYFRCGSDVLVPEAFRLLDVPTTA